jgi:hypothetical protein
MQHEFTHLFQLDVILLFSGVKKVQILVLFLFLPNWPMADHLRIKIQHRHRVAHILLFKFTSFMSHSTHSDSNIFPHFPQISSFSPANKLQVSLSRELGGGWGGWILRLRSKVHDVITRKMHSILRFIGQ